MVAPMSSSPNIVTSSSDNATQMMLMQAMLANMKPEQQAQMQALLAQQAKRNANRKYMRDTIRKIVPALTNGVATQTYAVNTPFTFNLPTTISGYLEGIIVRVVFNYTLATGTGATYALTAAGKLGILDTIEVRYNKSQAKFRPVALRQLALLGALDEFQIPDIVVAGQQDATLQSYLNPTMPVTTGAQTTNLEFFVPLNLKGPEDPRGVLPFMAGDTSIQVIVNTPVAILGTDPLLNAIYASGGTGNAISAIGGTIAVEAVYRDGDTYNSTVKMPFDISAVDGTFQMQIDQVMNPLVAGSIQRGKLNIMGLHQYVVLFVIDAIQSQSFATQNNITYIESSKDAAGANLFWRYGLQTNMDIKEYQFLNRLGYNQDLDPGCIPMIASPIRNLNDDRLRDGSGHLDNTRNGWADWHYGLQVTSVGALGSGPRIEPHVFYINPQGLVPV